MCLHCVCVWQGSQLYSRALFCSTQAEEYDLVDKARPADQRKSGMWETGMRGGGTRYILIGNIFSGLYCPVRDDVKPIRQVRLCLCFLI